ncbi:MAG: hypothetical protein KAT58_13110, partial [candidate division Zixibacteria bacterium]|nr:hypothetical protein [candidate division Zixibacteria bacterium]
EQESASVSVANRVEVDMQVATARRFPRSIKVFREKARSMALLDEDTITECFYALPRAGKSIEGPSSRLAESVASAWGNIRAEARFVTESDKYVTCGGVVWDLETNVAVKVQVRRRITNKHGQKFNDDLVTNAVNAANSIAFRNAVFKVVPKAYVRPIYDEARGVAIGNVQTLANKRAQMIAYFGKMGVTIEQILHRLDKAGVDDIDLDDLGLLKGVATALKEESLLLENAFPEVTTDVPATNGNKMGFGKAKKKDKDDAATKAEAGRQKQAIEEQDAGTDEQK